MQIRTLGRTGLRVSAVGFGGWPIGGPFQVGNVPGGRGPVDDRVSEAAIQRAVDLGVNFFETADVYGLGHSETVLGRTLRGLRQSVVLASKVGSASTADGPRKDFSTSRILAACEESLRRLGTDYLDLYQLHGPPLEIIKRGEAEAALERLRSAGKIRHFGVSIGHPSEGLEIIRCNFGSTLQVVFNVLNQNPATALLPAAARAGYGVIARVPLASGLLTGAVRSPDFHYHADDARRLFLSPRRLGEVTPRIHRFLSLCAEHGAAPAVAAIGFVLAHPAVSTAAVGVRTVDQAVEDAAGDRPLPEALLRALRAEFGADNFYLKYGLEKVV